MDRDDRKKLLDFPCDFPLKVMGRDAAQMQAALAEIIECHAPDSSCNEISSRHSSKGRFVALSVNIRAESLEQLEQIYQALSASEAFVMSL
ncbi:MAG TPA: DUF493 domain-containing protein [Gammaproteobacteria bacterium]|nr:DUF493 domain-containing protein [Gammaproteobacteria bacterium]